MPRVKYIERSNSRTVSRQIYVGRGQISSRQVKKSKLIKEEQSLIKTMLHRQSREWLTDVHAAVRQVARVRANSSSLIRSSRYQQQHQSKKLLEPEVTPACLLTRPHNVSPQQQTTQTINENLGEKILGKARDAETLGHRHHFPSHTSHKTASFNNHLTHSRHVENYHIYSPSLFN